MKTLKDLQKVKFEWGDNYKTVKINLGPYGNCVSIKDIKQMFIERIKHLSKIFQTEENDTYRFAQITCMDLLREIGNITKADLK